MLCLSCQRYKSKAIHNVGEIFPNSYRAVFIMSKIQIESNSQLLFCERFGIICCVYHVKDTNRKQFTTILILLRAIFWLCLSCQRYKSKAIHNRVLSFNSLRTAVFIMSKIQIESNSQPIY